MWGPGRQQKTHNVRAKPNPNIWGSVIRKNHPRECTCPFQALVLSSVQWEQTKGPSTSITARQQEKKKIKFFLLILILLSNHSKALKRSPLWSKIMSMQDFLDSPLQADDRGSHCFREDWKSLFSWMTDFLFTTAAFLLIFFKFIYLLRERGEGGREGGGQRERERENPKQAPHCQHRAWCGTRSHKLWDYDLSWSWMPNWLSTQAPQPFCLNSPMFRAT